MATYPPRRLLGARPLPSDPRRDPRRSDFPPGGGGRPRNLRCLRARFEGPAARHHHFLRSCGVLVPCPGMGRTPSSVQVQRPNHWTVKEFPAVNFLVQSTFGTVSY
ncbi:uncharacterized protein LOC122427586 isoform X2 [Cervus canadensis]|uniref:uncharacterized protein LOC122427586 isoform X2 n=1 Tax=Cervus canadensis TaxID=1574408 RepID=UPI001CA381C7|nr:uncharacterized protein LOC122427586 isoform X2 [Cervus canadensis]